jgi:hypothetical protein
MLVCQMRAANRPPASLPAVWFRPLKYDLLPLSLVEKLQPSTFGMVGSRSPGLAFLLQRAEDGRAADSGEQQSRDLDRVPRRSTGTTARLT